jgi:hypothetical protein
MRRSTENKKYVVWRRTYHSYLGRYYATFNSSKDIQDAGINISFDDFCEIAYHLSSGYLSPYA